MGETEYELTATEREFVAYVLAGLVFSEYLEEGSAEVVTSGELTKFLDEN